MSFRSPRLRRISRRPSTSTSTSSSLRAERQRGPQRDQSVLTSYPNATLMDQIQFKAQQASQVNQLLNLVYGLLALAAGPGATDIGPAVIYALTPGGSLAADR